METKRQVEQVQEQSQSIERVENTSGYYIDPSSHAGNTKRDGVGRSQTTYTTQLEVDDHKYHNDTLHGKAGLLYEVGRRMENGERKREKGINRRVFRRSSIRD